MCALIVIAVHDTAENKRTEYTKRTLESLLATVNFEWHRLFISDNDSCAETQAVYTWFVDEYLKKYGSTDNYQFVFNGKNIGTALAVNKGIAVRNENEYVIKMDNDVVVHQSGWVDLMQETIMRQSDIGILGLKRKDLEQTPYHSSYHYRSSLEMVSHEKGQRWIIVEHAKDIMGTCVMFNHLLMDKIGGLRQPGVYGWDDVDYSIRSIHAGFQNCFLPCIEIEHIDTGGDAYCEWKQKSAAEAGTELSNYKREYAEGKGLYVEPNP